MKEQVIDAVRVILQDYADDDKGMVLVTSEEVGGPPAGGLMLINRTEGVTVMINVIETPHKKDLQPPTEVLDTRKPSA